MTDERIKKSAEILVNHSARVKKGEIIQIIGSTLAEPLALELYKQILQKGAHPILRLAPEKANYYFYKYASKNQILNFPKHEEYLSKKTDAFMYIGGDENTRHLTSVPPEKSGARMKVMKPIRDIRLGKKWVIFEYPTNALAQEADMSLNEFEDFVYGAVIQDWDKQKKFQEKIIKKIGKAKVMHVKGNDTDISMSVEGRKWLLSYGLFNMPSGEVFTSPIEESVNGYIKYEFPAIYGGREVTDVELEFKDGKVMKALATKNEDYLKKMIAMDKGSNMLGEMGIGTNFGIQKFVKNILFDEKIGGTCHFALGDSFKQAKGTNQSALHWDMIKDLRKGGTIKADNKLIEKNGKFIS
ncbi:MAG: aminopeptidase [Candidatus Diapherotrites archaeon CG11_big_fil_rev_8_21_14_0_20_37_9]|nr:MAG: aminopeptidase [Candidatus Diapherotrites archaeon CG11_big_fil_rev_8_21_14_0_20_37_9]